MQLDHYPIQIIALLLIIAWAPIGWRFFRQWRERKNPISLAISLLVIFTCYVNTALVFAIAGLHIASLQGGVLGVEIIFCIAFYISFWRARKFTESRSKSDMS